MDRWEYKNVNFAYHGGRDEEYEQFNALGKQGWELVSLKTHSGGTSGGVFKRKIENSPTQARSENRQTYQSQNSRDDDWGIPF